MFRGDKVGVFVCAWMVIRLEKSEPVKIGVLTLDFGVHITKGGRYRDAISHRETKAWCIVISVGLTNIMSSVILTYRVLGL
jgi:hypothetical protein